MTEGAGQYGKLKRDILRIIWQVIESSNPERAVGEYVVVKHKELHVGDSVLNLDDFDRVVVVGAGKASAFMARGLESALEGRLSGGLVCVKYGHGCSLGNIEIIEAAHPLPDDNSVTAAIRTLEYARQCGARDLVICLLSGGASSIWSFPAGPITFEEKRLVSEVLLASGANIHEINALRKHISAIKGGRLARAAHPATLVTLAISDVVGDKMSSIGSGPTVGDPTTYDDALEVVAKYGIAERLPVSVIKHLRAGALKEIEDTPKPGDPVFASDVELIVASIRQALQVADQTARVLGYDVRVLDTDLIGEARDVGKNLVDQARFIMTKRKPGRPPMMLLYGGETTVTLKGNGRGGRNQELALAAAIEAEGLKNLFLASFGTDGTDGPTDAAGAFIDTTTTERGRLAGLDARQFLDDNNSYEYFRHLGDLIITGPTGTNVMDMQILVIG